MTGTAETVWQHGRFDARRGRRQVLFGRMYEDAAIELAAFRPGSRVFCIASAGCTALALLADHDVTAVDINPVQLEYARARLAGAPVQRGKAERVMAALRACGPMVGWRRTTLRTFLQLDDPAEQLAFWRRRLETRRFRWAFDGALSVLALRAVYAPKFLAFLPPRLGAVLRTRLARGFARHVNRDNPYAAALLLGEVPPGAATASGPAAARRIRLACADAATFLEQSPAASFDAFTLSNILDGADDAYRERLFAAVRHAAAPGAVVVLRSFAEPPAGVMSPHDRAADDRAMLWGVVDVRAVAELG